MNNILFSADGIHINIKCELAEFSSLEVQVDCPSGGRESRFEPAVKYRNLRLYIVQVLLEA